MQPALPRPYADWTHGSSVIRHLRKLGEVRSDPMSRQAVLPCWRCPLPAWAGGAFFLANAPSTVIVHLLQQEPTNGF